MKHIAAVFTIIYRFFSNIQFKKYTKYFELVLCVLGILYCVKVYKSWSEVQHVYHAYSLKKLTKDNSFAEISIIGRFDTKDTDTTGFESWIYFDTERCHEYINFETDIRDDSLKEIVQNVYKERMPEYLYSHITSVWKNLVYQSTDFFHIPFGDNVKYNGDYLYDTDRLNGVSVYMKRACHIDSIPSEFKYKLQLPKSNTKGLIMERYYNLDDIGWAHQASSSNNVPTTYPIKWYSKGDISQFSYSFVPEFNSGFTGVTKDVKLNNFRLHFGNPVSILDCSLTPDICNEYSIEYTDSTKLAYIARSGLYARIELVDNVNLQSYRLYILGAILSILISLALTLLYSILKSMGVKYSLVFLIIPAIVGFLIRISPLRNFPDAFGGHLVNISIVVYWASYAFFIIFRNFSKYQSNMKRYDMGLLLSACSAFYISNLLAWVYYLIS